MITGIIAVVLGKAILNEIMTTLHVIMVLVRTGRLVYGAGAREGCVSHFDGTKMAQLWEKATGGHAKDAIVLQRFYPNPPGTSTLYSRYLGG